MRPSLGALAGLSTLAFGLTACGGSSDSSPGPSLHRRPGPGLTLRQQVGQVLIISFAGTSPPAYVRSAVRQGRAAGVILFGGNVESAAQVRALTGALQQASNDGALVATDQEGGEFHTLPWAAPHEGERALADR